MSRVHIMFYIFLYLEMFFQCTETWPIPSANVLNLFRFKNTILRVENLPYSREKRQVRRDYDEDDDWYVFDVVEGAPNGKNDQGRFIPDNNVQFGAPFRPRPPTRPPTPAPFVPANAGPQMASRCEQNCNRQTATSQYNPVCGTNSVTYINLGRLQCAASCGINVSLRLTGRCAPIFPPM